MDRASSISTAISEAAPEACWLRSLYEELGFTQEDPTLIRGNNNGSIVIAKNPQFHKRTKHIAIRLHWVHNLVQDGILQIGTCRDKDQTANVLTKALPHLKHSQHTRNGTVYGLKGSVRIVMIDLPNHHSMMDRLTVLIYYTIIIHLSICTVVSTLIRDQGDNSLHVVPFHLASSFLRRSVFPD